MWTERVHAHSLILPWHLPEGSKWNHGNWQEWIRWSWFQSRSSKYEAAMQIARLWCSDVFQTKCQNFFFIFRIVWVQPCVEKNGNFYTELCDRQCKANYLTLNYKKLLKPIKIQLNTTPFSDKTNFFYHTMRHHMFRIMIQLSSNFIFYSIYRKATLFP